MICTACKMLFWWSYQEEQCWHVAKIGLGAYTGF